MINNKKSSYPEGSLRVAQLPHKEHVVRSQLLVSTVLACEGKELMGHHWKASGKVLFVCLV